MASKKRPPVEKSFEKNFSAPTVRTFVNWTPSQIRLAQSQADTGHIRTAASICEWIIGDDAVSGALSARTESLLGLVPDFEPSGDKRKSRRVVKALEASEDWWDSYPESELEQILSWGILLGVSFAKHEWEESESGRVLPMPCFWHPQNVRWDWETQTWLTRIKQGNEIPIVAGDGTWIVHSPFSKLRPWSRGLWRSLAMWVLFKQYAAQDWARYGEKGSIIVATSESGNSSTQRNDLANDLQNSGADSAVVLAAGFDLKLLEVSANTRNIYEAQIELANKAIAMRIRGGNLSSNVDGGSRAAAQVQVKNGGDESKLRFDAEALATTIRKQSLKWWAEFNFGSPTLAPWPVWPTEPEEDKRERAETIDKLSDGLTKLSSLGYEFDDKELISDFGLNFISGRKELQEQSQAEEGDNEAKKETSGEDDPVDKKPAQRLLSGARMEANIGFINGQKYADSLHENIVAKSQEILKPDLAKVLKTINEASSFSDLKQKILAEYSEMSADALALTTEKHLIMAELSGRAAVLEDL